MIAPNVLATTDDGLTIWRPSVASISVFDAGGRRHLVISSDGEELARFRLSEAHRKHLGHLLLREEVAAPAAALEPDISIPSVGA